VILYSFNSFYSTFSYSKAINTNKALTYINKLTFNYPKFLAKFFSISNLDTTKSIISLLAAKNGL
jgi:hypothetical protein